MKNTHTQAHTQARTNRVQLKTLALKHYTNLTMKQCRLLGTAVGYAKETGTSPHTARATDRLMTSLTLSRKVSKADRAAALKHILETARIGNQRIQTAKHAPLDDLLTQLIALWSFEARTQTPASRGGTL